MNSGKTTLRAIDEALNTRGIPTLRYSRETKRFSSWGWLKNNDIVLNMYLPDMYLPDDTYVGPIENSSSVWKDILRDRKVTTVRLVTNPEKVVVRETLRAFTYFSMYGMTTEALTINRMLPGTEEYFRKWAAAQAVFADDIKDICRASRSRAIFWYGTVERTRLIFLLTGRYGYTKDKFDVYRLTIALPFAERGQISLSRHRADLMVQVGAFKRNIFLPRPVNRVTRLCKRFIHISTCQLHCSVIAWGRSSRMN
jgi:hypothetical protein